LAATVSDFLTVGFSEIHSTLHVPTSLPSPGPTDTPACAVAAVEPGVFLKYHLCSTRSD